MISGVSQISGYTGATDLAAVLKSRREEMFSQIDTGGDGYLDTVELQSFSQQPAAKVQGPSADEIMAAMDTDDDGRISRTEFETAATEMDTQRASRKASPPPPEKPSFSDLDANGDGSISLEELEAAAPQSSGDARGPSADEFLAAMDANGNGTISQAEFDAAQAAMESRMITATTPTTGSGEGTSGGESAVNRFLERYLGGYRAETQSVLNLLG
ncbi:MAG: hypothetical protein GYA46_02610 [candidate division Zixibacteria bacterium]|nr:hypothetical protein [candidate division Zixibacteria bacterium]